MEKSCCRSCRWCRRDDRPGDYRRGPMWFCGRKGWIFSRNHRIGEGARIHPDAAACGWYQPGEKE